MTWIDGAEVDIIRSKYPPFRQLIGTTHQATVDLIVLHTTEGMSYPRSTYKARSGWRSGVHPHLTQNPHVDDEMWQHISLSRASYSLKSGDRSGAIQVELFGHAGESHTWGDDVLARIGGLVAKIVRAVPTVPLVAHHPFLGASDGLLAAPYPRGAARLDPTEWANAEGIIGHQHASFDDHWDPGRLDVHRIIEHARAHLQAEGLPDMAYLVDVPGEDGERIVFPGLGYRPGTNGTNDDPEYWHKAVRRWNASGVVKDPLLVHIFNDKFVWANQPIPTPAPIIFPEFPDIPSADTIAARVWARMKGGSMKWSDL